MWPRNPMPVPDLDLDVPVLAPRSRLFAMPPASQGSYRQEGLVSYLVRLARAHAVSPRRLVRAVFAQVEPAIARMSYANFFTRKAVTMDGLAWYAELFSAVTAELTSYGQTRRLTLLPLRELLPPNGQGLLAKRPRWCPACIAEMPAGEAFRPLVWSLELYRVCARHRHVLEDRCTACGRAQPFIPNFPDLGHCAHCRAPLGKRRGKKGHAVDGLDAWAAGALEDMVGHLDSLDGKATLTRFLSFIDAAVSHLAEGNRAAFCRRAGLKPWLVARWRTKHERPSVPQLLSFCYVLDVLPSGVFLASSPEDLLQGKSIRPLPHELVERADRLRPTPSEKRRLGMRLARIAADVDDTRPLSEVIKAFGASRSMLGYWFPDECARIRAKHAAARSQQTAARRREDYDAVTTAVRQLASGGRRPSRRLVDAVLRAQNKRGVSLVRPELREVWRHAVAGATKRSTQQPSPQIQGGKQS